MIFVPFGESEAIKLSAGLVKKFLAKPTRSGKLPTDEDCMKFVMLCKARQLNPWVSDAYLVGYDTQSSGPEFNLITAVQALDKRAEGNPAYDGMQFGVILRAKEDGKYEYIDGEFVPDGYILCGGWARLFRKDQKVPVFNTINLAAFDTGKSQWAKNPAGQIVKCARAAVLRKAFPTQLGAMYVEGEFDRSEAIPGSVVKTQRVLAGKVSSLNNALPAPKNQQAETFEVQPQQRETVNREVQPAKQTQVEPQQQQQTAEPSQNDQDEAPDPQPYLQAYLAEAATCETQADARNVFTKHTHPDGPMSVAEVKKAEAFHAELMEKLPVKAAAAKKEKGGKADLFEKGNENPA